MIININISLKELKALFIARLLNSKNILLNSKNILYYLILSFKYSKSYYSSFKAYSISMSTLTFI